MSETIICLGRPLKLKYSWEQGPYGPTESFQSAAGYLPVITLQRLKQPERNQGLMYWLWVEINGVEVTCPTWVASIELAEQQLLQQLARRLKGYMVMAAELGVK